MKFYIQIKNNLFYKIETGKVTAINTTPKHKTSGIKEAKCLPNGYVNNLKVITEKEYEEAKKLVEKWENY